MSPLKSQVSFSKDRSFALLRRNESVSKEGKSEEQKVEKKKSKKKDKVKEEKDNDKKDNAEKDKKDNGEKKDGRWTRLRKSDAQKAKDSDDTDREGSREQDSIFLRRKDSRRAKDRSKERKEKDSNSTLSNSLAISLAATLSPFSSFVSSHSPRGSRKGSPNRMGASSPPSPSPSSFFTSSGPNERPLSFTAPWDRRRERKNSRHSRSPNSTLRVRHSWGAPGSSSHSLVSSHSPTPSPAASSSSLSPATSQSESSSVSEDEGLGGVRTKSTGRTGIRPKIRISSAENSKESSPPPPLPSKPPPCIYPYRIEEGWELFHSTDTVAKHRKTCQSCRCTRELHDVYHEDWVNVRERLGLGDSLGRSSRERCLEEGYSWVPPGLTSEQIYDYMSCLPGHKVPRLGTPGEKYRERQLMLQLPKQDLALAFTRHVELQYHTSFKDFITARNDIALDIGIVKPHIPHESECRGCGGTLPKGAVAVVAPRLGDEANYHPACYTCSTCKEFLVDLVYCVWGDSLQCGRHYAEKLKPRCAACDELIFSGEYTKAMSKDWHSGHFCCWQCDESLTGQRYVLKDEHPYCIKCYEAVFANTCEDCNLIIGIDSKDLSYKDKHWHEKCFLCNKCQVSLVDKQFGSKMERIYCGPCYDAQFATRCDGCGEIFRAGNKKMEYKQRQWHEKCFACCVCKTPIGTKSFIPKDQDIYCAGCYEEKFATRCVKCDKIITSGGVTYKSEPWHRECFTCTHCNTSLAGQRFTSKDDKPYCADCFGELFAKRCTACTKPITGIGGTRFISFEDRHWHNDCFICAVCKDSLVGKGFITDGADILCPECAKQKLM